MGLKGLKGYVRHAIYPSFKMNALLIASKMRT